MENKYGVVVGTVRKSAKGYKEIALSEEDPYYCMAYKGWCNWGRYLVAVSLCRPLTKFERVEYKDGNPDNVKLSNLKLTLGRKPPHDELREFVKQYLSSLSPDELTTLLKEIGIHSHVHRPKP